MTWEIAQIGLVLGSTVVGVEIWRRSTDYLLNSTREKLVTGSAEVEGDPKTLAAKGAAVLAGGALGPVKIVEKTDDRVVFARLEARGAHRPTGGEFRFVTLGQNRTRVEWDVESPNAFHQLSRNSRILRVVGLVGLNVGGGAAAIYAAWFPEIFVQGLSLGLLWGVLVFLCFPFFLGWFYRQVVQRMRTEIDALANNLPHLHP